MEAVIWKQRGMRKGLEKVRCPLYCDDEYAIHIPVLVIYFEIKGTAPDQKMVVSMKKWLKRK
jgi:hypothetical protein